MTVPWIEEVVAAARELARVFRDVDRSKEMVAAPVDDHLIILMRGEAARQTLKQLEDEAGDK